MLIAKPIAILSKAALVKSRRYYSRVAQNQPERQVILQKKMYKKHGNQYIEACSLWWPRYHTASYYIVVQWAVHSAHRTCLSGDLGYISGWGDVHSTGSRCTGKMKVTPSSSPHPLSKTKLFSERGKIRQICRKIVKNETISLVSFAIGHHFLFDKKRNLVE